MSFPLALPALSRRSLMGGLVGASAVAAFGLPRMAFAQTEAAATGGARPLVYDRPLGDMTLTTILDGQFVLGRELLLNADPAMVDAAMTQNYLDPAVGFLAPISAHLVRSGSDIMLIDAGAGTAFGPTAGRHLAALAAIGVTPEAVTRIILTHMHPDHVGGLITEAGAVFPNASLHVSAPELAFWTDETIAAGVPDGVKPFFALAAGVATAYGERVTPFEGEADFGGGVSAIAMPGHTPGHTGFRLSSGSDQIVIWGDTAALAALQFSNPEVGLTFDTDAAAAAETRKKVMAMLAADKIAVAGSHLPFPGIGHIEARDGAFAWVPEEWKFL